MGFKHGFGDRAGRNTANALFNLLGIDFSDRRRISIDNSRKVKAEARANLDNTRAEIEHQNQLNSLDAAVLDNVDKVVALSFSMEPSKLCSELCMLKVQLETNSWGAVIDDEQKIRNKYTNAVFSKFKSGVSQLEILDPNNPSIDEFQATIRKARWRKFLGAYWPLLFFLSPFLMIFIGAVLEKNPNLWSDYWWVIIGMIVIVVGIFIYSSIRRAKKHKDRIVAYAKEHTKISEPELSVISTPVNQPDVTPITVNSLHDSIPKISNVEYLEPVEREWPITTKRGQNFRYSKIWQKYKNIGDIMGRGFAACYAEKQKDILIVGFNPHAGITESNNIYLFPFSLYGYWGYVTKMIVSSGLNLMRNSQYLDLFAFRESNQEIAIKEVIQNPALFPYVVEQVSLTQEFIETIVKPRVIVIKDKASWAFFGKLPQFTWMGYSFEPYLNTPYGEICKITGFSAKRDRINKQFENTNIEGTYVLFLETTEDGAIPTPEFLESLL